MKGGREGGREGETREDAPYLDDRAVVTSVEVGGGGEEATHVLFHQKDPESVISCRRLPGRFGRGGREGGREEGR